MDIKNSATLKLLGLATLIIITALCSQAARADEKGQKIAQAVYDRPDGQTAVLQTTMILRSKDASERSREFYSFRKDLNNGEILSLIRFALPKDVKDTGLLTQSHADGTSDQWLYLPALGRERRIAGERKGGRFVGSEIYYEDLQDRKPNQDTHTYKGRETIEGAACDVIESVPVDAGNSTYSKRILWVHPQTLIPIRIDFYKDANDQPVKRLKVKKIENIQGN